MNNITIKILKENKTIAENYIQEIPIDLKKFKAGEDFDIYVPKEKKIMNNFIPNKMYNINIINYYFYLLKLIRSGLFNKDFDVSNQDEIKYLLLFLNYFWANVVSERYIWLSKKYPGVPINPNYRNFVVNVMEMKEAYNSFKNMGFYYDQDASNINSKKPYFFIDVEQKVSNTKLSNVKKTPLLKFTLITSTKFEKYLVKRVAVIMNQINNILLKIPMEKKVFDFITPNKFNEEAKKIPNGILNTNADKRLSDLVDKAIHPKMTTQDEDRIIQFWDEREKHFGIYRTLLFASDEAMKNKTKENLDLIVKNADKFFNERLDGDLKDFDKKIFYDFYSNRSLGDKIKQILDSEHQIFIIMKKVDLLKKIAKKEKERREQELIRRQKKLSYKVKEFFKKKKKL